MDGIGFFGWLFLAFALEPVLMTLIVVECLLIALLAVRAVSYSRKAHRTPAPD